MIQLDHEQRLSQSILWEIQRRYFLKNGVAAWQNDEVPHAISCSPYMARTYSRIVFGYLRDCMVSELVIDQNRPIYFIELGAGTGRLTYHFLHQFYSEFLDSPFADWPIKFVLTDFVPATIEFWQAHPQFQPWVEAGLLDFALFDAESPQPLHLIECDERLMPEMVHNPVVLFANYFFDSIPHDCFVIEDGQVRDCLLTVSSSQPEPDLTDPTIWERLTLMYVMGEVSADYPQPRYNTLLNNYANQPVDSVLTFPNCGLDCLRFWQQFENVLLLTSDRGHADLESLLDTQTPSPNLHGSFSLMVNYHAISEFIRLSGGMVCQAEHYQDNLQVLAYGWGDAISAETTRAFTHVVTNGGPDDFFALQSVLAAQHAQLTLSQLLSFLRFSAWDADLFRTCYPSLLMRAEANAPVWNADVYAAVMQVWGQYLVISADDDLELLIEQLLTAIGVEIEEES